MASKDRIERMKRSEMKVTYKVCSMLSNFCHAGKSVGSKGF